MILPLALAQFIASYAATNMNVAISAIATDLDTTVAGVQIWFEPPRQPTHDDGQALISVRTVRGRSRVQSPADG